MMQETWRDRLQDQLRRDGRSMREVSLAAELSAGYLHGILKDGKDPTIDRLAAIAKAMNVSLAFILVGLDVTPETEQVVQALQRDPDRRDAILRLLKSTDHS
ncbi:helix-turn-helix domain-containing protein [Roseinatronobacter sp.]